MSKLAVAAALALTACGGSKSPAPSEPAATPGAPAADPAVTPGAEAMAPDACTAQGGEVRGDIGDGKVACADGETDLGRVKQGIEGAVCCR